MSPQRCVMVWDTNMDKELVLEVLRTRYGPVLVRRAKISGGWLVYGRDDEASITFVPDPTHEWDGGSLP
jgi:hypothetical protein